VKCIAFLQLERKRERERERGILFEWCHWK